MHSSIGNNTNEPTVDQHDLVRRALNTARHQTRNHRRSPEPDHHEQQQQRRLEQHVEAQQVRQAHVE